MHFKQIVQSACIQRRARVHVCAFLCYHSHHHLLICPHLHVVGVRMLFASALMTAADAAMTFVACQYIHGDKQNFIFSLRSPDIPDNVYIIDCLSRKKPQTINKWHHLFYVRYQAIHLDYYLFVFFIHHFFFIFEQLLICQHLHCINLTFTGACQQLLFVLYLFCVLCLARTCR